MMRIAFQGERGAFSEEAANCLLGSAIELLPLRTVEALFEAVESEGAQGGLVPVENSQIGPVAEVLDLLLRHRLHITEEIVLPIHHCLLGRIPISAAKTAHSHIQALAQCAEFLVAHGLAPVEEYDTAGSAKLLAEGHLPSTAVVIASRAAGARYGLSLLAENIESHPGNATRFYLLEKSPRVPQAGGKTAIAFAVDNSAGSLHRALSPFAKRRIHVTRLESRPRHGRPWEYTFYLEFQGNVREPEVGQAIGELEGMSHFLRLLGCFTSQGP